MDRFVAYSNMGPLVMGFYDGSKTKLWEYAQHYTLLLDDLRLRAAL